MDNVIINNFLLSVVHCLQLCFSNCSLIGYYEKWKLNFLAAGLELDHYITYQQWRFSWYSFLSLLDVDYASGFICDISGVSKENDRMRKSLAKKIRQLRKKIQGY